MINFSLFKRNIKIYLPLLFIFFSILLMYFYVIVNMYNPNGQDFSELLKQFNLSPEMISAFGFQTSNNNLTSFISSYYYGMIMLLLPMIFEIILANGLVNKIVENGNITSILSTPIKRTTFIFTQLITMFKFITILVIYVTVIGIFISEYLFKGLLDINKFIIINVMVLLLHYALSTISFFFSSLFNDSKNSLMFSTGIPTLMFLTNLIYNMDKSNKITKYLNIFSLFDPVSISKGENYIVQASILIAVTITLSTLSIYIFNKKDLNI